MLTNFQIKRFYNYDKLNATLILTVFKISRQMLPFETKFHDKCLPHHDKCCHFEAFQLVTF